MSVFKKCFRGYRISDVNKRINELESQIEIESSKCRMLENQLFEARQAADNSRNELKAKEREIKRLIEIYENALATENKNKRDLYSIGRVYVKAFESGREIVMAPVSHVNEFLGDIEKSIEESRVEISEAEKAFNETVNEITSIVSDIKNKSEGIGFRLRKLSSGIEKIDYINTHFEKIKQSTNSDIERIKNTFEKMTKEYTDDSVAHTSGDKEIFSGQFFSEKNHESEKTLSSSEPSEEISNSSLITDDFEKKSENVLLNTESFEKIADESISSSHNEDSDKGMSLTDTYVDFIDNEESNSKADMFTAESNVHVQKSNANEAKDDKVQRGQNILNLLNKYRNLQ